MTRLLVIGVGPRPGPAKRQVFAPGLRLDTIVRELVNDGHDVAVGEFLFGGRESESGGSAPQGASRHEYLPPEPTMAAERIADLAGNHRAEAVIALTDVGALAAVRSEFAGPLFADYFGHPMAERQMQAEVHGSGASLHEQWLYVLPVLLRADALGVCSQAQRYALTGELGAAGRLNPATCGHDLVHVLRPALPFSEPFASTVPGFLRGGKVAADARIILFTGGYNTWLDEAVLFNAVERVLGDDPQAVYVSTGGEIEGHVNKVFNSFRARTEESPHRKRYQFLGWIEHNRFVDCCLEADVGVCCDRWTLEGEFGCRNRLFGWIWAGMRVVASDPSELTAALAADGMIEATPAGDAAAFAEKLGTELRRGRPSAEDAAAIRAKLLEFWSPRKCYAPLLEWARDPQRAPDRQEAILPDNPLTALQQRFLDMDDSLARDMEDLVRRLTGSRAVRVYATLHPEVQDLIQRIERKLPRRDLAPDS